MRGMTYNYNKGYVLSCTQAVCYVLNILNIFSCFFPVLKYMPKQWIWFKGRPGFMCRVSYFGFGLCLVSWVNPAACVLHASVCLGSNILAAQWRHQSGIWNCSKYQALGRFVICYITYPANKVSLESAACFCCRMERNTPVWFTYCKTKCSLLLCPTKTWKLRSEVLYFFFITSVWSSYLID